MFRKFRRLARRAPHSKQPSAAGWIMALTFGAAGAGLLTISHAATMTASTEAEAGNLTSNAQLLTDGSAAGGRAVKFGATPASYYFGTLDSLPSQAQPESAAGVKVAMVELNWASYEPTEGSFSASYIANVRSQLNSLRAAGRQITLALGVSSSPSWLLNYPDSKYIDQAGTAAGRGCSAGVEPNLIFNEVLRQKLAAYYARIDQDFDLSSFWSVRLTSGSDCEMLYPDIGGLRGHYWAYDSNAQNGANLPPTMSRNPYPGWKPGDRTYNGTAFTTAQVGQWADWYIGALDNMADWQMTTLTGLGFKGYYEMVTPGSGERPDGYASDVNDYLATSSSWTSYGAAWDKFYGKLADKTNVVTYISSMADGSGGDDQCQATDDTVFLSSPAADSWSATRWFSRIADEYHLGKAGENPGYPGSASFNAHYADTSAAGLMAVTFSQMQSCHLQGIYWAHDDRLYDGTVPFSAYQASIALVTGGVNPLPAFP